MNFYVMDTKGFISGLDDYSFIGISQCVFSLTSQYRHLSQVMKKMKNE